MAQTPTCPLDGGSYRPPLGDCAIYSEPTVQLSVAQDPPCLVATKAVDGIFPARQDACSGASCSLPGEAWQRIQGMG